MHMEEKKIENLRQTKKESGTRVINKALPYLWRIHIAFLKTFCLSGGKVWVLSGRDEERAAANSQRA